MNRPIILFVLLLLLGPTIAFAGEESPSRKIMGDRDSELKLRINKAIVKGMEYLQSRQKEDGSWAGVWSELPGPYKFSSGETALALLTLLRCGVGHYEEYIKRGFVWLRQKPFRRTCEIGLLLMALQENSKRYMRSRGFRVPPKKVWRPTPADFGWMKEAVQFLLSNNAAENPGMDREGNKYVQWGYPSGRGDHLNTMFAVQGLFGAHKCGIEIPKDVWDGVIRQLLASQESNGPEVQRMKLIESIKDGSWMVRPWIGEQDRARGWGYKSSQLNPPPTGEGDLQATCSMTCACTISLVVARRGSNSPWKPTRSHPLALPSIHDGLAWLDLNWDIRTNPRHPLKRWHFFSLACLHWAMETAGLRNLGKHDWYREGAEYLLDCQSADGSWNDPNSPDTLSNTCFAILFLAREIVPHSHPYGPPEEENEEGREDGEF